MTSLPGTYVTNIEIKTKSIEKADKHSTDNKYIWPKIYIHASNYEWKWNKGQCLYNFLIITMFVLWI